MCGRFSLNVDAAELQKMIPDLMVDEEVVERFNIAPTQQIATVLNTPERKLTFTHWGLIPSWAKDTTMSSRMINARGETVHEKPSFRAPFRNKRCLILADGFYEWQTIPGQKTKIPMYFRMKSGLPFAFAGLWDCWRSPEDETIESSTIITIHPNELVAPIHNRMPVILPKERIDLWLSDAKQSVEDLRKCLVPYPAGEMEAFRVLTNVNSVRNDDSSLLMPLFGG